MNIKIEKIIYPGKSLGRLDGKVVMLDEGLPGETVDAEITGDKDNYFTAAVKSVVNASSKRVIPRCGHYRTCSSYQYIDYPEQSAIKEGEIKEMFSHQFRSGLPEIHFRQALSSWGYRNKVHLHVISDNGSFHYAYHTPGRTNSYEKVDTCFLLSETMSGILARLLSVIREQTAGFVEEVVLRESSFEKTVLLAIYGDIRSLERSRRFVEAMGTLGNTVSGVIFRDTRDNNVSRKVHGNDSITESVSGVKFVMGDRSFFQVNVPVLEMLVGDLKRYLSDKDIKSVYDLYCGVGTFGAILSGMGYSVTGVESENDNYFFLKENCRLNGLKTLKGVMADAGSWLKDRTDVPDMVLVDPPRIGLRRAVIDHIMSRRIQNVVYISCNPSTLMRDLKIFCGGYSIKEVYAYDFFPQTPHIECMVMLSR